MKMAMLQGYRSGEGWYVIDSAWAGDELPDLGGALRLMDGNGSVICRNRSATLLEEAIAKLSAKQTALAKKALTKLEQHEYAIIVGASYFSIVVREQARNNPVDTVPVEDRDWEAAFAIARAVQKKHDRALLYAVRRGGQSACVEAQVTTSHIKDWLVKKGNRVCLLT
jgi:hypothetical protein